MGVRGRGPCAAHVFIWRMKKREASCLPPGEAACVLLPPQSLSWGLRGASAPGRRLLVQTLQDWASSQHGPSGDQGEPICPAACAAPHTGPPPRKPVPAWGGARDAGLGAALGAQHVEKAIPQRVLGLGGGNRCSTPALLCVFCGVFLM